MSIKLTGTIPNLPKFCDSLYMDRLRDEEGLQVANRAVALDNHDFTELYAVYHAFEGMEFYYDNKTVNFISALILNAFDECSSFYIITFSDNSHSPLLTRDELVLKTKAFRTVQVWDQDTHESEVPFGSLESWSS